MEACRVAGHWAAWPCRQDWSNVSGAPDTVGPAGGLGDSSEAEHRGGWRGGGGGVWAGCFRHSCASWTETALRHGCSYELHEGADDWVHALEEDFQAA